MSEIMGTKASNSLVIYRFSTERYDSNEDCNRCRYFISTFNSE
jgi:hypothetical protein